MDCEGEADGDDDEGSDIPGVVELEKDDTSCCVEKMQIV